MKIKVSIQIIFKLMIIVLMIFYLPSYSHQNVKLFKAISTTEALPASIPVTSNKKIHLYNTHQGEQESLPFRGKEENYGSKRLF